MGTAALEKKGRHHGDRRCGTELYATHTKQIEKNGRSGQLARFDLLSANRIVVCWRRRRSLAHLRMQIPHLHPGTVEPMVEAGNLPYRAAEYQMDTVPDGTRLPVFYFGAGSLIRTYSRFTCHVRRSQGH